MKQMFKIQFVVLIILVSTKINQNDTLFKGIYFFLYFYNILQVLYTSYFFFR